MKRINKMGIVAMILFLVVAFTIDRGLTFAAEKRGWPNCPAVLAEEALVMDVNTGTVLLEKNATEKAYPASITKVMTVLLALENATSLDEKVIFTREAIEIKDRESSSIGMLVGEELRLEDCLYAIMLASANEVANAVAIHTAGSIEDFVDLMNEKAEELGCVNTHFQNPNGLHDEEHYTCALDMAKIGREAVKHETFKKIAGTRSYVIPKTEKMDEERPIANYHQMINPAKYPQYAYEYCYSGKTGYTTEAGRTLISFAKKGTMNLVCVILKAETRDAQFGGTAKLFDYCFKRFRMEQAEKVKLEYRDSELYSKIFKYSQDIKFYVPPVAMLAIPKRSDIQKIEKKIKYYEVEELKIGENEVGLVEYQYYGRTVGTYPLLYKSDKRMILLNSSQSEENRSGEIEEVKELKEESKNLLLYKISIVVGVSFIIVGIIGLLLFLKRRRYRRRFSVHRRLRRRRGNRFW